MTIRSSIPLIIYFYTVLNAGGGARGKFKRVKKIHHDERGNELKCLTLHYVMIGVRRVSNRVLNKQIIYVTQTLLVSVQLHREYFTHKIITCSFRGGQVV